MADSTGRAAAAVEAVEAVEARLPGWHTVEAPLADWFAVEVLIFRIEVSSDLAIDKPVLTL